MHLVNCLLLSLGSLSLLEAASTGHHHHLGHKRQDSAKGRNGGGSATCLNANALQTASALTGQEDGSEGIKPGQAPSATDSANFINFCSGQTLTDGKQINDGSCNGIPMGKIPSVSNMVSAIILNPQFGDKVPSDTTFNVSVQTRGLAAGFFTNPTLTYYNAPQDLSDDGQIIGHCHVTLQNLGKSLNPTDPPDPSIFAFFKGIDDAGNGRGLLQAQVGGGLPPGFYRVCTMIAARNHQPVTMPVAQRGAQDDCTKFEVVDSGKGNNGGNNGTGNEPPSNTAIQTLTSVTSIAVEPTGRGGASEIVKIKSGTLGGEAPFVVASGNSARPFSVNGNTFVDAAAAVDRSCSIQFNSCADAFNRGDLNGRTISDCEKQRADCTAE